MTSFLRLTGALLVALVLWPGRASADQVIADFDRDGLSDVVSVDPARPSVLRVWLSGTSTLREVHTAHPVHRMGAFDMDGDGHPELVTSDASAGLHVWRGSTRGALHPVRRRHPAQHAQAAPRSNLDRSSDGSDDALPERLDGPPSVDAPHVTGLHTVDISSRPLPFSSVVPREAFSTARSSRAPPLFVVSAR